MASGKLSPRQKMINMMYLVLIALLALNVSKEILKSFHLMEVSFNKAKENLDSKIKAQLVGFADQKENDPKLIPYYKRAMEAQRVTDEFVAYIETIKSDLEKKSGGRKDFEEGQDNSKPYNAELQGMDNIELHANYFMVDNADGTKAKGWKGLELENKINDARAALLKLLESDTANGVNIKPVQAKAVSESSQLEAILEASDVRYKTWAEKYLEHSPLAGVMTMLTKVQSDAKSTQGAIMDVLQQGKAPVLKIEALIPVVKATKGNVVMVGESFEAEIFLAAKTAGSENDEYKLTSGGSGLTREGSKAIYKAQAGKPGTYKFTGVITVQTPEGPKNYNFENEYQVFQGGATISATAMNVLYIGVPNPISVGVPGVNPSDVNVSMSGGSIRRDGKEWVATVTTRGEATISASAKVSDGSTRKMGSMVYRVKSLPRPEARWGALASGSSAPGVAITAQSRIEAT
ncbi:MAG: gliding motility-associated protein GldM, partial [Bacteroidia bacterium]